MPPSGLALYLHPAAGLLTLLLAVYAASLGLRARRPRGDGARRRHAALGPWVYGLVLANWMGGMVAIHRLDPELEAAATGHFQVGTALVGLFTAAALLSRRVPVDARARVLHPLLGAAAIVLGGFQIFLGLQLLP